ncbi:MAG: hypothetical protein LBK75_07705 [Oscillospiraceae bacterium]|jgi:hypothetical protein|nr:hypothetical protein [Oscillospiraceae bacterium]
MKLFVRTLVGNMALRFVLLFAVLIAAAANLIYLNSHISGTPSLYTAHYFFVLDGVVFLPLSLMLAREANRCVFTVFSLVRYVSWRRAYGERLKMLALESSLIPLIRLLLFLLSVACLGNGAPLPWSVVLITLFSQYIAFLFVGVFVLMFSVLDMTRIGAAIVFVLALVDLTGLLGRSSHVWDLSGVLAMNTGALWYTGTIPLEQVWAIWIVCVGKTMAILLLSVGFIGSQYYVRK